MPDPGPCDGRFIRFFYNPSTNDCEFFIYGGCAGNGNNFATKVECSAVCRVNLVPPATTTTRSV